MNIGIFTDTYTPDINGVVSSIKILENALIRKGHKVYVICPYSSNLKNFKVIFEDNIVRLPGIELKQLYGYAMASPFHFSLIKDLKKLNLDLIHVHTEFGVGIFARIVAKNLNIPLVSTYHTTYEDYTHYINPVNFNLIDKGTKKAVAKLSKLYIDSCIKVIAPSFKTKNMLINYGIDEKNIKVIPTGLDLKRFSKDRVDFNLIKTIKNKYQKDNRLLIYVGRIATEKSIEVLIKSFDLNKDKNLKVKLLIVGSGPEEEKLIKMTKDLKLEEQIFFLGKKSHSEIASYYNACDAFVSASTSETQGMTYIEALASGLQIFVRNDDVVKDLVDENITGYFFDDEKDLALKIEAFCNMDINEIKNKSKLCIDKVKIYDDDIFIKAIEDLYQEAINDYCNCYYIKGIKIKNDNVILNLNKLAENKISLMMSLDDYYNFGLRKTNKISESEFQIFKNKELELKVYATCFKKISVKDFTIKQMYDFIINKFNIPIDSVNQIIEKLENKNLLNDHRYAEYKFEMLNRLFYSRKKIIRTLQKDGISMDIIDAVVSKYQYDDEVEFAIKNADKYFKKCNNRSIAYIKKYIYSNLKKDGFNDDTIQIALEHLDFSNQEKNKFEIIKKHLNKALRRFENKSKGSDLRNKIFRYLYAQGFEIADIYVVLDEMEWDDEKR